MKKIVAFIAFLIFIFNISISQTDLRFGFQTSPTFTFLDTDDRYINANHPNTGLKLGVLVEMSLAENYSFVGGLGFAFNHGGTIKYEKYSAKYWINSDIEPPLADSIFASGVNLKYSVQYVEIPVGLKMKTREFGVFRFFIEPNLTFGFKSQARGKLETSGISEDKINIKNEVNNLALSWSVGGGTEYGLSPTTSIVAGIFYQRYFSDISNDNGIKVIKNEEEELTDDLSKAIMSAITIRLAVMF